MIRLHSATYTIPTRRPLWMRLWVRLQLAYLRWCLRSLIDERDGYERAGVPLGPIYIINSEHQERDLRNRIGVLECLA